MYMAKQIWIYNASNLQSCWNFYRKIPSYSNITVPFDRRNSKKLFWGQNWTADWLPVQYTHTYDNSSFPTHLHDRTAVKTRE